MSLLQHLFESHARNAAKFNKWFSMGDPLPTYRAWLRAEQLLRLDIVISEHRKEYATSWEPLLGHIALNHLLFVRTKWTPSQIDQLRFQDKLLVLQQDLAAVNIQPESVQAPQYIAYEAQQISYQTELPPCSEEEWDPSLSEIAQGLRRPS